MNEQTRKFLQEKSDFLKALMNENSIDFVECNYSGYFCDCFHEYADSNTSIYYYDQRQYYNEHVDECMNALEEYGYTGEALSDLLKKCGNIEGLVCKAGAIGEYSAIYNELSSDEENIKKLILINIILENDQNLTIEQVQNMIENFDPFFIDEVEEIQDYYNEQVEEMEA